MKFTRPSRKVVPLALTVVWGVLGVRVVAINVAVAALLFAAAALGLLVAAAGPSIQINTDVVVHRRGLPLIGPFDFPGAERTYYQPGKLAAVVPVAEASEFTSVAVEAVFVIIPKVSFGTRYLPCLILRSGERVRLTPFMSKDQQEASRLVDQLNRQLQ